MKIVYYNSVAEYLPETWINLTCGKIGGFVVRGFFGTKELEVVQNLVQLTNQVRFEPFEGYSALPRPFSFVDDKSRANYETETSQFLSYMDENEITDVFRNRVKKLAPSMNTFLSGVDEQSEFSDTWSSLRILESNKGQFPIHCGNYFRQFNTDYFSNLDKVVTAEEQLSYFIMIQKPKTDVAIEVYDAHWKQFKSKIDDFILFTIDGKKTALEDIECNNVVLQEGDILIFNGGDFWHRVPGFEGKISRITLGGFISFSIDKSQINLWA
jgi:hypothetical protein